MYDNYYTSNVDQRIFLTHDSYSNIFHRWQIYHYFVIYKICYLFLCFINSLDKIYFYYVPVLHVNEGRIGHLISFLKVFAFDIGYDSRNKNLVNLSAYLYLSKLYVLFFYFFDCNNR